MEGADAMQVRCKTNIRRRVSWEGDRKKRNVNVKSGYFVFRDDSQT